jgi:hypothetical protein
MDVVDGRLLTHRKVTLSGLQSRSPVVQTRLVLFSYDGISEIDCRTLDDICFAFQLDPFYLWRVLDDDYLIWTAWFMTEAQLSSRTP